MAVLDFASIKPVLPQNYQSKLAKQWNALARLLSVLEVRPGKGINCAWVADLGGQDAAAFADGYAVQTGEFRSNTKKVASLDWAEYRTAFSVTQRAVDAAASSVGGAQELVDLIGNELYDANAAVISKLNKHLRTGSGANDELMGLNGSLITSGSYAGINVGTSSAFASNVYANGGTPRNFDPQFLADAEADIYDRTGRRPDLIVMPSALVKKYASEFETVKRFVNDANAFDLGVKDDMLYFQGIPVIRDKDETSGQVKLISRGSMHIEVLPPEVAKDAVVYMTAAGLNSNGDEAETLGIPMILEALAKDGPSMKFSLRTPSLQLVITHPNRNAVIKDLQ